MNKMFLLITLISLLATSSIAQYKKNDISKITYEANWGGLMSEDNIIVLEITNKLAISMFNNTLYDSTSSNHMNDLINGGSRTISIEEFSQLTTDSLADYFIGKIPSADYKMLGEMVMQATCHNCDSNYRFCCCDIPSDIITVYFNNGKRRTYLNCNNDGKYIRIVKFLRTIANRPGYGKPTSRISFPEIH